MQVETAEVLKIQLRLPPDVHAWLVADAQQHDRSMNGQMIAILRERMRKELRKKETPVRG